MFRVLRGREITAADWDFSTTATSAYLNVGSPPYLTRGFYVDAGADARGLGAVRGRARRPTDS